MNIPWKQFLRYFGPKKIGLIIVLVTSGICFYRYGNISLDTTAEENTNNGEKRELAKEDQLKVGGPSQKHKTPKRNITLAPEVINEKLEILRLKIEELSRKFDLHEKSVSNKTKPKKSMSTCSRYNKEAREGKVTILDVWRIYNNVPVDDVTLVTQMSTNKIGAFVRLLPHWSGPISIAVYIKTSSRQSTFEALKKQPSIFQRDNIGLHLVAASGTFYPINFLRNVALNRSRTNYIHLADVDFTPNYGAHDILREFTIKEDKRTDIKDKRAYVIPALEAKKLSRHPNIKSSVIHDLHKHRLQQFHKMYRAGHTPTNLGKWVKSSAPYIVGYKGGYEPYIVIQRRICPRYDQAFMGRYYNKIQHIIEVHAARFQFYVLPNVWTIHYNHRYESSGSHHKCSRSVLMRFKKKLRGKYKASNTSVIYEATDVEDEKIPLIVGSVLAKEIHGNGSGEMNNSGDANGTNDYLDLATVGPESDKDDDITDNNNNKNDTDSYIDKRTGNITQISSDSKPNVTGSTLTNDTSLKNPNHIIRIV